LVVLYGPSGAAKSFLALDWALTVQTGHKWLTHQTTQGSTLYIVGEGMEGMKMRCDAWMLQHQLTDPTESSFIPNAVQLCSEKEVAALLNSVPEHMNPPALVIFDTLARCTVGSDENSATEMGRVVAAADKIRAQWDSTVVIVHHISKNGGERGSSALRGAADTMIEVTKKGIRCSPPRG
jgi:RecA-family ATPase